MTTISRIRARLLALTILKAAAAALALALVAPITAAQNDGRTGRRGTQNRQREKVEIKSHIPPIIITDGSLKIQSPDFSGDDEHEHDPKAPRPHHYKKERYGHITRVSVVVTRPSGPAVPYNQLLGMGYRVHLFLQRKEGNNYVWVDESKPQVLIRGNRLVMEMDKELQNCRDTNEEEHTKVCEHPGYGNDVQFRIGRVQIVRGSSTPFNVALSTDRSRVEVTIYMEHPHP